MRLLLSSLGLACVMGSTGASAEEQALDALAFGGCTLSAPCKLATDDARTVLEEKSNAYVGATVVLKTPVPRRFKALIDAEQRPYLIDFGGSANAREPVSSPRPDSSSQCPTEIVQFGSTRRYTSTVRGFLGFGELHYYIALADDMTPVHKAESLAAIDLWVSSAREELPITSNVPLIYDDKDRSIFDRGILGLGVINEIKASRRLLGPHFRGAIVACGWVGDLAPMQVWQTRLLDLPLAATASGSQ